MEMVEILRYATILYLLCGLGVLVVGFVEMLKRKARVSTVVAVFLLSPIVVGRLFRFMLARVLQRFAAAVRDDASSRIGRNYGSFSKRRDTCTARKCRCDASEVMNEMKQIVEG